MVKLSSFTTQEYLFDDKHFLEISYNIYSLSPSISIYLNKIRSMHNLLLFNECTACVTISIVFMLKNTHCEILFTVVST